MSRHIDRRTLLAGAAALAASPARAGAGAASAPFGPLELAVAARAPSTPTGLTLSRSGRMFLFMPRFDAATAFTAGEVFPDGRVAPYPSEAANRPDPAQAESRLIHVPNGVVDRQDRLWLLDAGLTAASAEPLPGGAKLVCIDLATDRILRTVPLGSATVPTSSLNDLRIDAGATRIFVSDQGQDGQGAILAVDLASGRAVRRLAGHPSTRSVEGILKIVEGRVLMKRPAGGGVAPVRGGANGLALSPDGRRLYYGPLMSRRLSALATEPLLDPAADDDAVAASVTDLGEKGLTGGLIADARDRLWLSLQEFDAIGRRDPDGTLSVLARDPRLVWPDTFWITPDNWLYVSAAQANRRPEHNDGTDRQQPPYAIFRMRIDAGPA